MCDSVCMHMLECKTFSISIVRACDNVCVSVSERCVK